MVLSCTAVPLLAATHAAFSCSAPADSDWLWFGPALRKLAHLCDGATRVLWDRERPAGAQVQDVRLPEWCAGMCAGSCPGQQAQAGRL